MGKDRAQNQACLSVKIQSSKYYILSLRASWQLRYRSPHTYEYPCVMHIHLLPIIAEIVHKSSKQKQCIQGKNDQTKATRVTATHFVEKYYALLCLLLQGIINFCISASLETDPLGFKMYEERKSKSSKGISGFYLQLTGKNQKLMCFNTLLIKNQV